MSQSNHPDVKLFHSYEMGQFGSTDTIHVRIVTVINDNFPWGLGLEDTFTDEALAEAMAVKVQAFVDSIRSSQPTR